MFNFEAFCRDKLAKPVSYPPFSVCCFDTKCHRTVEIKLFSHTPTLH